MNVNIGKDYSDKVALITGGTSGIGLAAAKIFLATGNRVAVVGRNVLKGQQAVQALQEYGEAVYYIEGDVSKTADCQKIVAKVIEHFGQLNIVVNSAGQYMEKAITDVSEQEYDDMMQTHVKGTYFIVKFAIPELKKAGNGAIVNVSSDAGINGNLLCTAYCAAKGAINTFTKALALELSPYNIRVNCVCPGDIYTPLLEEQLSEASDKEKALREMASIYPLNRIGQPEEVAKVICFLCSEDASFVTGAIWTVDGGITAC